MLPQEIIDEVVGQFSPLYDAKTLKSCSLVSSSFRDPAQKKIFHSFTMFTSGHAHGSLQSRRYEILRSSARICAFVEEVTVLVHRWGQGIDLCWEPLPKLPHIRRLGFTKLFRGPEGQWASGPEERKKEFLSLLQSPFLESLYFDAINDFPANALQRCSKLRVLSATQSTFSTVALDIPGSVPSPPITNREYLHFLCLRHTPIVRRLADSSMFLSLLRTQRYITEIRKDEDYTECQEILRLSASCLEDLTLDELEFCNVSSFSASYISDRPFYRIAGTTQCLDFRHLHNLRRITITPTHNRVIPDIARMLESISDDNSLERITIHTPQGWCAVEDYKSGAWRRIDDLLARERHAAHFKQLCVLIKAVSTKHLLDGRLAEYFKEAMSDSLSQDRFKSIAIASNHSVLPVDPA